MSRKRQELERKDRKGRRKGRHEDCGGLSGAEAVQTQIAFGNDNQKKGNDKQKARG
jgi:hypothetical protein